MPGRTREPFKHRYKLREVETILECDYAVTKRALRVRTGESASRHGCHIANRRDSAAPLVRPPRVPDVPKDAFRLVERVLNGRIGVIGVSQPVEVSGLRLVAFWKVGRKLLLLHNRDDGVSVGRSGAKPAERLAPTAVRQSQDILSWPLSAVGVPIERAVDGRMVGGRRPVRAGRGWSCCCRLRTHAEFRSEFRDVAAYS